MSYHLSGILISITKSIHELSGVELTENELVFSPTKREFEGDYTLVVFSLTRHFKMPPEKIAECIGNWLVKHEPGLFKSFNVIKGFLNVELDHGFWIDTLAGINQDENYGKGQAERGKVLVEFSSPNTNKPLHLGHIRNILLGWSTSKILEFTGHDVVKTQIINDRGIAICKSMLAWQKYGEGQTPESKGVKGDLFVGEYYRIFETKFSEEYLSWQASAEGRAHFEKAGNPDEDPAGFFKKYKNTYFNENSTLGKEAKNLLRAWEAKDPDARKLWVQMNNWVYDGFNSTYDDLGVNFDTLYYESDTYLLGKDIVELGLSQNAFYRNTDGSVWVDLEDRGLDKKILLRSDGTSVYMTQDLGTAQKRYADQGTEKMIYVVADEQDYHFKVLFEILKKLGEPYADGLFHLSYGMVDLPSGRMKSREGTVVDADDLIAEVIEEVRKASVERGELEDITEEEKNELYSKIGLAALKFFILRVNPQKRMVFNPEESVDIQGQTGPYIQNAYVRIRSIVRRMDSSQSENSISGYAQLEPAEIDLIMSLMDFPSEVEKAANSYDPSVIANFAYDLAKRFHKFYHDVRILNAKESSARAFRLLLSMNVAQVLKTSMHLLGIEMPERM